MARLIVVDATPLAPTPNGARRRMVEVLRRLLSQRPELGDARYLLGKALLAEGQPAEALPHLEGAVKAAPGDPAVHYQLGQAYQRLGRAQDAEREFEAFRKLKEATRN